MVETMANSNTEALSQGSHHCKGHKKRASIFKTKARTPNIYMKSSALYTFDSFIKKFKRSKMYLHSLGCSLSCCHMALSTEPGTGLSRV